MKQSILSRKLLRTGRIENLSVISRAEDGTFCAKAFEVETANTLFCDGTLVLTSKSPEKVPFEVLNKMNYEDLLKFFLDFTVDDNPVECKHLFSMTPGNVVEIQL